MNVHERLVDTRAAARYLAVRSDVYFGWWEESQFQTRAAALKNVSQGGALVNVAVLPSPEAPGLWLSMGGDAPTAWTGVSVVGETNPRAGLFQVRLRFVDGCPYELHKQAVHGIGDVLISN